MTSILHSLFPFVDFLYILQLEDYNSKNYWRWVGDRLFKRGFQKTARILWTKKAYVLLFISFALYLLITVYVAVLIPLWWWLMLTLIITTSLIPCIILLSNIIFTPIDVWTKKRMVDKARRVLQSHPNCTVVAIVGSQGKTSARHFLTQLLADSFVVHTPKANNNVGLSIASDIIHNLTSKTQVYIVEFGELYRGDLTYLNQFLQPKIIVLTSISSQHSAQFGSQAAIDREFIGLLNGAKQASIFVNGDDPGIKRIEHQITAPFTRFYSFHLDTFHQSNDLPEVLHIDHMQQNAAGAVMVAEKLGVDHNTIAEQLKQLRPVERRMNKIENAGVTVIDDSYNISPESAIEALEHLAKHEGRKIIVTGGIVDQGNNEAKANQSFGKQIAAVADIVVVAQNRLAKHIEIGLGQSGKNIEVHPSFYPDQTPDILAKIVKKGDVVLVQNELPDLYWS